MSTESEVITVSEDELALRVYHARLAGYSVERIADDFGVPVPDVIKAYNTYRVSKNTTAMDREEARLLELDRVDDLSTSYYEAAKQGDHKSGELLLKFMQHRYKLLEFDSLDPATIQGQANIIVLGEDRASFMEALQHGRLGVAPSERIESEEAVDE